MTAERSKPENIKEVKGSASNPERDEVEGSSEDTNTGMRSTSGRIVRPSTAEVRHEVMRLSKETGQSEFERGIKVALEWILGDRKTLRRPDK
jgi:hypothetical protein